MLKHTIILVIVSILTWFSHQTVWYITHYKTPLCVFDIFAIRVSICSPVSALPISLQDVIDIQRFVANQTISQKTHFIELLKIRTAIHDIRNLIKYSSLNRQCITDISDLTVSILETIDSVIEIAVPLEARTRNIMTIFNNFNEKLKIILQEEDETRKIQSMMTIDTFDNLALYMNRELLQLQMDTKQLSVGLYRLQAYFSFEYDICQEVPPVMSIEFFSKMWRLLSSKTNRQIYIDNMHVLKEFEKGRLQFSQKNDEFIIGVNQYISIIQEIYYSNRKVILVVSDVDKHVKNIGDIIRYLNAIKDRSNNLESVSVSN